MEEVVDNMLITKTSFNFKNKKEENNYWDNLLIESPLRYKNTYSKYLHEKLHVYYSFREIFKYFFCGIAFLSILAINPELRLINYSIAGIFGILSLIYHFIYKSFYDRVIITESLNSIEILEEIRDWMINEKETNKK